MGSESLRAVHPAVVGQELAPDGDALDGRETYWQQDDESDGQRGTGFARQNVFVSVLPSADSYFVDFRR